MAVHPVVLRALTLELRQAAGIERTVQQVENWLVENFKYPARSAAKILADPDLIQQVAKEMRIPFLENGAPSSDEIING